MTTGRPPAFSKVYIDCKFPSSDENANEGELEADCTPSFSSSYRYHVFSQTPPLVVESWGFRFARDCVSELAARTLTAETPSYATILELDYKVREFPIPPEVLALLQDNGNSADEEPLPLAVKMQRFVLSHTREVSE